MQKTPYYSYKIGSLPKGCRLCVAGAKEVVFITGLCPRSCYFCPISDQKYKKDIVYADEWPVKNIKDVIAEARSIDAKGAGITGGDPLCRLNRTLSYIRRLKKEFGRNFHIHLYTSLDLVTRPVLQKLNDSGLDEIRFHLDLENQRLWHKLEWALDHDWGIGVEIPVIPKMYRELWKIIRFIHNLNNNHKKHIFLNLNELESADNKTNRLLEKGFKAKSDYSYAIKGSEELALRLLRRIEKGRLRINVHYCTATLKDKVQLANRIKRRAKTIKRQYDQLTPDGTLIRGAIYLEKPSFGYRKELEKLTKKQRGARLIKLKKIKDNITKKYSIKNELISLDHDKLRILIKPSILKKIREPYVKAIVEEYPTYDLFELNIDFI